VIGGVDCEHHANESIMCIKSSVSEQKDRKQDCDRSAESGVIRNSQEPNSVPRGAMVQNSLTSVCGGFLGHCLSLRMRTDSPVSRELTPLSHWMVL
jgi:hypothetical protein